VLLDEPTAALGVEQTQQAKDLIRWRREHILGVAVISHNLADIFDGSERIIVLQLGWRAADAPHLNLEIAQGQRRREGGQVHGALGASRHDLEVSQQHLQVGRFDDVFVVIKRYNGCTQQAQGRSVDTGRDARASALPRDPLSRRRSA